MTNNRFLRSVAQYCIDHPESAATCMVFPNKRSAIFFRRYLTSLAYKNLDRVHMRPETITIGHFLEQYSELTGIESIDALFEMYEAYRTVSHNHGAEPMPFDSFVFWGRMLINDFDDLDASLADAHALYKNLADLKEIQSNFLSEEQLEVLKYVFGDHMVEHYREGDNGRFWRHIDETGSHAHSRFLELWQILGEIYDCYRQRLALQGRGYAGMMARRIAATLANDGIDGIINHRRIAFVGFNAPSVALMRIMQLLQRADRAQFFWDPLPDSPVMTRAARRVNGLIARFSMPQQYVAPVYTPPVVEVHAVPSKSMQAKDVSHELQTLKAAGKLNADFSDNTAVVLPDPTLLSSLVQSLPNSIGMLNITMGLPMRNTFFASVMRNIISLQVNADVRHGDLMFRSEDVRTLVSNPKLLSVQLKACRAIIKHLDRAHSYMVSAQSLTEISEAKPIALFFEQIKENDATSTHKFLSDVLHLFTGDVDRDATTQDQLIALSWKKAVDTVYDQLGRYRIDSLGRNAYFGLVWRIISTDELHVSGSPLKGVQVMGMLETRCLDFDNVIITSFNEGVCPPAHRMRTFIPAMLRRAFAMPVHDDYSLEYDYYTLRLLSRSKRVVLLYDSRTTTRRNARSHIIDQLINMPVDGMKLSITPLSTQIEVPAKRVFAVEKTPEVMARVNRLLEYGSGMQLSASSIKTLRKCPLQFYLSKICKLREDNEAEDYMTADLYGTIVHKVLENIFRGMRENDNPGPAKVTAEKLNYALDKERLNKMVLETIDNLYHKDYYKNRDLESMPGESLMLGEFMVKYIDKVLRKELATVNETGPFFFVEAEEKYSCCTEEDALPGRQIDFGDGHKVNFTFIIDRHDIMSDGTHRFVDYKTGDDKNEILGTIDDLFREKSKSTNDAAMQLLLYTEAYAANNPGFSGEIAPKLYKLLKAFRNDNFLDDNIKMDKEDLVWSPTAPWRADLNKGMSRLIADLFDVNKPFRQTDNIENCKFCSFLDLCMRSVPEY